MMKPGDRWAAGPGGPATLLFRRYHGSLDSITDSERRALRPIGTTAREVATRTGVLLADLFAFPNVQIFQGVRPMTGDAARIQHAVSAGRRVMFIESVAWPPGQYAVATASGRVHCDGMYTGQSVRPLIAAVWQWREILPDDHRVSALVVVHPAAQGDLSLPAAVALDLAWARAGQAMREIQARLPCGHEEVSMTAVTALAAATTEEENR
ncbi:MAG TPA: hypothetical protein VKS82_22425 [Streptosporangiaceae bacterium]|nr:hypothetical protein [Streptosporangiaceae bacterium]